VSLRRRTPRERHGGFAIHTGERQRERIRLPGESPSRRRAMRSARRVSTAVSTYGKRSTCAY